MAVQNSKIAVLFVCTGNICRSPTAEAVFRHQVEKAGLTEHFHVDSAGTHGYHVGDVPDPRSIDVAARQGVDMCTLKARKIEPEDFDRFDYILAMDSGHHGILERFEGSANLSLFLKGGDVPDPYYGSMRDFEHVYSLVDAGCLSLLEKIRLERAL